MTHHDRHPYAVCLAAILLLIVGQAQAQETYTRQPDAVVVKVYDGDTVTLRDSADGHVYTVHLAGVDAPIRATRERDGQEPWGAQAQQFLSVWLAQLQVSVLLDASGKTAHLWADGLHVNTEILRQGHAMRAAMDDDAPYAEVLAAAESAARASGRGVWNPASPLTLRPSYVRQHGAELDAEQTAREQALALPDYRDGCVVAHRLTHLAYPAGHRHYDNVRESANALYFATLDIALAAGYSAATP